MRIIIFIVSIILLLASGVKAKIMDYSNCHIHEIKLNDKSRLSFRVIFEKGGLYFPDPETNNKTIKLEWSQKNFDAYNTFAHPEKVFFSDGQLGLLRLHVGLPGFYEKNFKDYKTIKKFDKYSFSINTENSTITHIYSYSDEWFNLFVSKEGVKKTNSSVYKIKSYSDQTVIGIDESKIYGTGYEKEVIVNLKKNTFKENLHSFERHRLTKTTSAPDVICNNLSLKSKSDGYLNYWWAVILIAAVIFFIYTQTGRELKITKEDTNKPKANNFIKKNKSKKSDKDDFNDYLG